MSERRYGDYEVVKYFATGGMADLYLARHPSFPRQVVVKTLQPRYVEESRVVRMLLDEGRIAKILDHPNIVKMLDIGEQGGEYFIAMEHIAGRDLLAVCRRGVEVGQFMTRHLAAAIVEQTLRGLQYAHEKTTDDGGPLEFVHRDISPGNLVISWGGTVKIVDFGIARAKIQMREAEDDVAGKYNYMAPEQIRGEPLDGRADLFALGVILYELSVGKRLFRGRPEQVMHRVLEEPLARPTEVRPDYPPALEAIVMRALERDRDKRWPSARLMRKDLKAWLDQEGVPAGKRELAEYMRDVFGARKVRESDEFTSDHDDEELKLDAAVPGAVEEALVVDPEEADPHGTAPTVRLPPEDLTGPMQRVPPAEEDQTKPGARPPVGEAVWWAATLMILSLVIAGVLIFFLLRR